MQSIIPVSAAVLVTSIVFALHLGTHACMQIVDVLGEEGDGWWKGVLLGERKQGVFPDNFVELLPQKPSEPPGGQ